MKQPDILHPAWRQEDRKPKTATKLTVRVNFPSLKHLLAGVLSIPRRTNLHWSSSISPSQFANISQVSISKNWIRYFCSLLCRFAIILQRGLSLIPTALTSTPPDSDRLLLLVDSAIELLVVHPSLLPGPPASQTVFIVSSAAAWYQV